MLTMQDIQRTKVDLGVVKEGVVQAEKRLTDALDTRKHLDQKAFTLLGGYATISMALFGVAATKLDQSSQWFFIMLALGCMFFLGLVALFLALKNSSYGTVGRYPDTWLQPGTLDGGETALATTLAYILHGYQGLIAVSDVSNGKKAFWLNVAILLGVASPGVFLLLLMLKYLF